jgi:hypothetical protein
MNRPGSSAFAGHPDPRACTCCVDGPKTTVPDESVRPKWSGSPNLLGDGSAPPDVRQAGLPRPGDHAPILARHRSRRGRSLTYRLILPSNRCSAGDRALAVGSDEGIMPEAGRPSPSRFLGAGALDYVFDAFRAG